MTHDDEHLIDTVDLHRLRSQSSWPIMRLLAPRFVEQIELGRYMRRLLTTHQWSLVRIVPHTDADHLPSKHLFDVYGVAAGSDALRPTGPAARG